MQQRLRHRDPLAVALGELADRLVRDGFERALLEHGLDPVPQAAARHPPRLAEEAEEAVRGHVRIERAVLGEIAEVLGRLDPVGLHVDAGDPRRPVRGGHEAGQEPHGGRLARPVGPEERHHLPARDRERDVADRQERAELLGKPSGFDHHGRGHAVVILASHRKLGARPAPSRRPGASHRTPLDDVAEAIRLDPVGPARGPEGLIMTARPARRNRRVRPARAVHLRGMMGHSSTESPWQAAVRRGLIHRVPRRSPSVVQGEGTVGMSSSSPLRGGFIGCGFVSQYHLEAWKHVPRAGLVAVCDHDPRRLEGAVARVPEARPYRDAAAMFAAGPLDFVEIATRPESHRELVELAAGHGAHILCQKPAALTRPRPPGHDRGLRPGRRPADVPRELAVPPLVPRPPPRDRLGGHRPADPPADRASRHASHPPRTGSPTSPTSPRCPG